MPGKMDVDAIFFDLDGTLFLSTPILHEAYRLGVEEYNKFKNLSLPVPREADVLAQVGNPVSDIYSNLFPGVKLADLGGLGRMIVKRLTAEIKKERGEVIEGVFKLLEKLKESYRLAIITNAQRVYLEAVAETYDLERFFEIMLCIEDVEAEQKAALIEKALNYFDLPAGRVLMVGDRSSDLEAAKSCGTKFIGCLYGHGNRSEFSEERTITHLNQLPEFLG
ncbi:MAG: HAD family hydrolase [bacterium]